jgi:MFS family permease
MNPRRHGTRRGPPAEIAQAAYAWRVLSVTSLGLTLTLLNTTSLTVALQTLTRHFHASATQASCFVLSYLLVNTAFILVFGRITDLLGRKRLYMLGLFTITVSGLACAFAPNADTLIALRAVQGIGGAAILANTTALLTDAFPPRLLPVGLSLNVTAASAASVVGPAVGGLLLSTLGWRAVFGSMPRLAYWGSGGLR